MSKKAFNFFLRQKKGRGIFASLVSQLLIKSLRYFLGQGEIGVLLLRTKPGSFDGNTGVPLFVEFCVYFCIFYL